MNRTIVAGRIAREMNTAGSSQNLSTNEGSVARTVLGTSLDVSNLSRTSDGVKTALGMSTAVSNQNPTSGLEDGRAIMAAAKDTYRAKAAAMKIEGRASTVTEGSGKAEAARAVALETITETALTSDP
jgi:hypothetical protein